MNPSDESIGRPSINSIPSADVSDTSFTSPIYLPTCDHTYNPVIGISPHLLDLHPPYPFACTSLRLATYIIPPPARRAVLRASTKLVPKRPISLSHDS